MTLRYSRDARVLAVGKRFALKLWEGRQAGEQAGGQTGRQAVRGHLNCLGSALEPELF